MPSDVEKRTLSPQELLRIEGEEQKTKKAVEAENGAREQLHLEREADNLGLENTTNGRIRKLSPKSNAAIIVRERDEETQERLINFFRGGAKLGDIGYGISAFASTIGEGLRTAFWPSAQKTHMVMGKDGSQLAFLDEYAVTQATQEAIEEDQAVLTKKFNEFQAIDMDAVGYKPGTKMSAGRELVRLKEEFNMLRHPLQRDIFVASIERIEAMEAVNRKHGVECTGTVHVFCRVAGPRSGGLGMRVNVGDQYDQKPAEVIASGAHLQGPNAPSPV